MSMGMDGLKDGSKSVTHAELVTPAAAGGSYNYAASPTDMSMNMNMVMAMYGLTPQAYRYAHAALHRKRNGHAHP